MRIFVFLPCLLFSAAQPWICTSLAWGDPPSAQRGYELLVEKPYLPTSLNQRIFDNLWRVWPRPLRDAAAQASVERRRQMAFAHYGFTRRPGDASQKPLQYVVQSNGNWTINCFACHGGQIAGQIIPGLPNANLDLQTFIEETRLAKLLTVQSPSSLELASLLMPLASTRGTTNAVMFGVMVMHYRDADLSLVGARGLPEMIHHAMDAPPWWHLRKKERLYIDGFAQKGHRALMPFLLAKQNGPQRIRQWEDDYRHVLAYLESLEAPIYPYSIDHELAAAGKRVFQNSCAECHGSYGDTASYPERVVDLETVGTDPVRLEALSVEHRARYAQSWFAHYGQHETLVEPTGYVAPPLDGLWASAPYFHNGSVPTLWHVLYPEQRPVLWRRSAEPYDSRRVGIAVEVCDELPAEVAAGSQRRQYYDTRQVGQSRGGHLFPELLDDAQKRALLEYLKTL